MGGHAGRPCWRAYRQASFAASIRAVRAHTSVGGDCNNSAAVFACFHYS